MRQEYLDVLSKGYSIEICVDYDASGRSVDEDEISPDCVIYYIREGELRTWNDDEVITEFECIDDSEWDEHIEDEDSLEGSWFECMMIGIISDIVEEGYDGETSIGYWLDEGLKIGALLKDEDDNVLEEMWGIDLADIL